MERSYLCIDLKSFYASVECRDRGLDPFTTNLVVADPARGRGTICLAVSPSLRARGVPGRCRVFELPSCPDLVIAPPRMRRYMEVSAQIYRIYLRYLSPEDMHVYSVDECFMDATPYRALYQKTPDELAKFLMDKVAEETGIQATAGVGPNLFLAKVALDVLAKHAPNYVGVLDEETFKLQLWHHRPITDIWGIGPGNARRLASLGVHDLAGVSLLGEEALRREFGVAGKLLYDHAWGIEPCTLAEIKNYRPHSQSLCHGQVLHRPYGIEEARIIVREMTDVACLDLTARHVACSELALSVGYEMTEEEKRRVYRGPVVGNHGARAGRRLAPRNSASRRLTYPTSIRSEIMERMLALYDEIVDSERRVKRINLSLGGLVEETNVPHTLFAGSNDAHEKQLSEVTLAVRRKFGKNALLRGTNFFEAATGRQRNQQVGGHHE